MAVEEVFGIEIADGEAQQALTLNKMTDLVQSKLPSNQQSREEIQRRLREVWLEQVDLPPDFSADAHVFKDLDIE